MCCIVVCQINTLLPKVTGNQLFTGMTQGVHTQGSCYIHHMVFQKDKRLEKQNKVENLQVKVANHGATINFSRCCTLCRESFIKKK